MTNSSVSMKFARRFAFQIGMSHVALGMSTGAQSWERSQYGQARRPAGRAARDEASGAFTISVTTLLNTDPSELVKTAR